jgi:hypothetical protein
MSHAHSFAELRDINKIRMHIWEMEEGEGAFSHDKAIPGSKHQCWKCRDRIKWTQGQRGTRDINRDCEKPENRSVEL